MSAAREFLLGAATDYGWGTSYGRSARDFSWMVLHHQDREARLEFTPTGRIRTGAIGKLHDWAPTIEFTPLRPQHKAAQVFFWMLDGSGTDEKGHRVSNPQPEVEPVQTTLADLLADDASTFPDGHPCRDCGRLHKEHPTDFCEGWR